MKFFAGFAIFAVSAFAEEGAEFRELGHRKHSFFPVPIPVAAPHIPVVPQLPVISKGVPLPRKETYQFVAPQVSKVTASYAPIMSKKGFVAAPQPTIIHSSKSAPAPMLSSKRAIPAVAAPLVSSKHAPVLHSSKHAAPLVSHSKKAIPAPVISSKKAIHAPVVSSKKAIPAPVISSKRVAAPVATPMLRTGKGFNLPFQRLTGAYVH